MANLGGLLGTMLATGMAGRSARGPAFATSPGILGGLAGGGGLGGLGGLGGGGMGAGMGGGRNMAGMAALGYLAYKAFQQNKANNPAASGGAGSGMGLPHVQARNAGGTGSSLGDRMGDLLGRGPVQDDPAMEIGDQKALLLIRAMVAAANADGQIDNDERRRILSLVEQSGAGPEERRILEREMNDPPSMDDIVAQVRDPETAEQVFIASQTAIVPDGRAEKSYLNYLADRLNLSGDHVGELRRLG